MTKTLYILPEHGYISEVSLNNRLSLRLLSCIKVHKASYKKAAIVPKSYISFLLSTYLNQLFFCFQTS